MKRQEAATPARQIRATDNGSLPQDYLSLIRPAGRRGVDSAARAMTRRPVADAAGDPTSQDRSRKRPAADAGKERLRDGSIRAGRKRNTMLTKIAIAGALLAALTTSALAAASDGAWAVLQDAGGTACYVSNRAPAFDEARLSRFFQSEQQAQAAIESIAACQSVNIEHDKDSVEKTG